MASLCSAHLKTNFIGVKSRNKKASEVKTMNATTTSDDSIYGFLPVDERNYLSGIGELRHIKIVQLEKKKESVYSNIKPMKGLNERHQSINVEKKPETLKTIQEPASCLRSNMKKAETMKGTSAKSVKIYQEPDYSQKKDDKQHLQNKTCQEPVNICKKSPISSQNKQEPAKRTPLKSLNGVLMNNKLLHTSTPIKTKPQYSKETYPKTSLEVQHRLEKSRPLKPMTIPMLVVKTFEPSEDWTGRDEVTVKKGMVVTAMYKFNDWVYVKTHEDVTGFIPYSCVCPIGVKLCKQFAQQYPELSALHKKTEEKLECRAKTKQKLHVVPTVNREHCKRRIEFEDVNDTNTARLKETKTHKSEMSADTDRQEVTSQKNIGNSDKHTQQTEYFQTIQKANGSTCKDFSSDVIIKRAVAETVRTHTPSRGTTIGNSSLASAKNIAIISPVDCTLASKPGDRKMNDSITTKKQMLSPYSVPSVGKRHVPAEISPTLSSGYSSNGFDVTLSPECPRKLAERVTETSKCHDCVHVNPPSVIITSLHSFNASVKEANCTQDKTENLQKDHYENYPHRSFEGKWQEPHFRAQCQSIDLEQSPIRERSFNDSLYSSFTDGSISFETSLKKSLELTVLYDYIPIKQDHIKVQKHDIVTLLEDADPDWIWVMRSDGAEGYMPKNYAIDLNMLNLDPGAQSTYL